MDVFLARYAVKNSSLGLSMTQVLLDTDKEGRKKYPIACYYTLATGSVACDTLPTEKALPTLPGTYHLACAPCCVFEISKQRHGEKSISVSP